MVLSVTELDGAGAPTLTAIHPYGGSWSPPVSGCPGSAGIGCIRASWLHGSGSFFGPIQAVWFILSNQLRHTPKQGAPAH